MIDAGDRLETAICDLCGQTEATFLFDARDYRYGLPGSFRLVRCDSCGLVYLSPRPTRLSIDRYYPTEYAAFRRSGEYAHGVSEWLRSVAFGDGRIGSPMAGWLYNSLAYRAFVPAVPGGRVLDIGCGTGAYLEQWKSMGWCVEGVEPSPEAAEFARQRLDANIQCCTAEDAILPAGAYDVVAMCHTLEHVHSPMTVLRKIRESLNPDGQLLIMVPNFGGLDRKLFGDRWHGLEVPRHLYHFEPQTLRLMLYGAGYESVSLHGSAEPSVFIRNLFEALGRGNAVEARGWLRTLWAFGLLPFATANATSHLWAAASAAGRPAGLSCSMLNAP